jgi:glutamyl-tRNA synthetase
LLQRALGIASPGWWHVPLVIDEEGRRLAKRADDVSLYELRTRGVDPRAVVGWVARVSGVADVGRVTASEGAAMFSFDRVSRGPIVVPNETDAFVELLAARR